MSCGRTDWVGFIVHQKKWKSPENVCVVAVESVKRVVISEKFRL